MKSWPTRPLDSIAIILMGQSPPGDTYNSEGIGLPFFQGKAEFGDKCPTAVKWCSQPTRTAEAGDILLSVRAPVGPTNFAAERCCIGRGLAAIRARAQICDQRYLRHYLVRFEADITAQGVGSTFHAINRRDVEKLVVPLPPLEEQKRIVQILDEAEELQRLRREVDRRTDDLIPALFHEMFGDPTKNLKSFPVKRVKDIVNLTNGYPFKPSDWGKTGRPIIRIQNLKNRDAKFNYFDGKLIKKYRVDRGDLLISWAGQLVSFGVFVWNGPQGVLNQHIFRADPIFPETERLFLLSALSHVVEKAKSSFQGIEMKHLTKGTLEEAPIVMPPVCLQREYAAYVTEIYAMEQRQSENRRRIDDLVASLLHRAFAGEL